MQQRHPLPYKICILSRSMNVISRLYTTRFSLFKNKRWNSAVEAKLKTLCIELRELIKAISLQITIKIEEFWRRGR